MLPCPRRAKSALSISDPVSDKFAPCCSYCGSMNPDRFMALLSEGKLELEATDKDYKVYVHRRKDVDSNLTLQEMKFYFQHLSVEQRKCFVELWNADLHDKKLFSFSGDFSFYVMPFFMKSVNASASL